MVVIFSTAQAENNQSVDTERREIIKKYAELSYQLDTALREEILHEHNRINKCALAYLLCYQEPGEKHWEKIFMDNYPKTRDEYLLLANCIEYDFTGTVDLLSKISLKDDKALGILFDDIDYYDGAGAEILGTRFVDIGNKNIERFLKAFAAFPKDKQEIIAAYMADEIYCESIDAKSFMNKINNIIKKKGKYWKEAKYLKEVVEEEIRTEYERK
jgi:hypothetical protein